jgi:hypothetical protein
MTEVPSRARRRLWPKIAIGVSLALVLAAVAFVFLLPGLLRNRVVEEARGRGLAVKMKSVELEGLFPWDARQRALVAHGVTARSLDAPEVEIDVGEVRAPLSGLAPGRIEVDAVQVTAPDVPTLMAFEQSMKRDAKKQTVPIVATNVTVNVTNLAESVALGATATAKRIESKEGSLALEAVEVSLRVPLVDVRVGPVSVDVEREPDRLWLRPHALRAVRLGVNDLATTGFVEIDSLTPRDVAPWLPGLAFESVSARGQIGLALSKAPNRGSFEITVVGIALPLAPEVAEALGRTTIMSGEVSVDARTATIEKLQIKAGVLTLLGAGSASLDGPFKLDASGSADCKDIAASVLAARLGPGAGLIAGGLAGNRVSGRVDARLIVEGDLRDPKSTRVTPTAVVGCNVAL